MCDLSGGPIGLTTELCALWTDRQPGKVAALDALRQRHLEWLRAFGVTEDDVNDDGFLRGAICMLTYAWIRACHGYPDDPHTAIVEALIQTVELSKGQCDMAVFEQLLEGGASE